MLLLVLAFIRTVYSRDTLCVFKDNGIFYTSSVICNESALVHASFSHPGDQSLGGWGDLKIAVPANNVQSDSVFYAAGIAEGVLTCKEIWNFYQNSYWGSFGDAKPSSNLVTFMQDNLLWVRKSAIKRKSRSNYWREVHRTMLQFDGIVDGYNSYSVCGKDHPLTSFEFVLLNAYGDLFDLMGKFPEMNQFRQRRRRESQRCSACIRLVPDNDLIFGHSTWDTYATSAPRIYKTISLPILKHQDQIRTTAFSSSPGLIASLDDWYILRNEGDHNNVHLAVLETSLNVYNTSLYAQVTLKTIPCWIRVTVANKLAVDGSSWTQLFSYFHSGTYNNEWMIVDVAKYHSNPQITDGLLFVLDELPGMIRFRDETGTLRSRGYWASYNIPYFQDIFEIAGYAELALHNDLYSYSKCPRANIFRERFSNALDVDSFQYLIEYNDWEHDPLSLGDPSLSISARGDLNPNTNKRNLGGGIDSKMTSARLLQQNIVYGRVGPTHSQQPVFCWSSFPNSTVSHDGHPQCFNYSFSAIEIHPNLSYPFLYLVNPFSD